MKIRQAVAETAFWWTYYCLTTVAYALAWPVLAFLAAFGGSRRDVWRERMGFLPRGLPRDAVWIHAASVGEVAALGPVVREIRKLKPRVNLVISTMTETGRRRARAAYGLRVVLAPLDVRPCVKRWLRCAAPQALFIMETELWPIWLGAAARQFPVAWINGRISDRAFPRYLIIRSMMRGLFSRLRILCVISERDALRVRKLGASASRIHVLGNVKADLAAKNLKPTRPRSGQWFVAGSTRPGEEKPVLVAFRSIQRKHPRARLCLAPRHLERVPSVQSLVEKMGFAYELRSGGGHRKASVLILDTHGELGAFYARAVAAFVGGTLVPVGGHSVLEPASAGIPVFFGPYIANVREQANGLLRCGGGFRITSAESLAGHWDHCLRSPKAALAAGRRAWDFVDGQRGVARRLVRLLERENLL